MRDIMECWIQVVTPIHIGCDEVYEPTSFVVDEGNNQLMVFDPFDMIRNMDAKDKAKFSEICRKGTIQSILELYLFLRGRRFPGKPVAAGRGFVDHYSRTLSLPRQDERKIRQELNNFVIARTAFLPESERPYIPGSAIKGSIRTAYLNLQAKEKRVQVKRGRYAAKELERELLDGGRFSTDPFRMLKVSDFLPVGDVKTRIVYAVNEKKEPSRFEARGPYQLLEVIEPGSRFVGWIRVQRPENGSGIKRPISRERVFRSTREFYEKQKKREDEELNKIGVRPPQPVSFEGSFPLRMGRHSGAESVTIEGYRRIKIIGQRDRWEDHATTIWLASREPKPRSKTELQPFGWAVLGLLEEDQRREYENIEERWRRDQKEEIAARVAKEDEYRRNIESERRRAEEEAKKRVEEEALQRQEEEKRRREWEAMTPGQRDISKLKDPELREEEVVRIYQRLDEHPERREVAAALKEYWVSKGKWRKRDCSRKQWEKVVKVRRILGED